MRVLVHTRNWVPGRVWIVRTEAGENLLKHERSVFVSGLRFEGGKAEPARFGAAAAISAAAVGAPGARTGSDMLAR